MPLVSKAELRSVGILVYDGMENLDFTGPLEVFVADVGHSLQFVSRHARTNQDSQVHCGAGFQPAHTET